MRVYVKKLVPEARIPEKANENDFCYDVWAVSEEEVTPGVWKYGLGLAFQIDKKASFPAIQEHIVSINGIQMTENHFINTDSFTLSIDLRPRSSIYKTGMILSNCEATIDEGYRGEVAAIFYHVKPELPRYKVGDKLGQIKIGITFPIEFEEKEKLDKGTRGKKGFGSSGEK